MCSGLCDPPSEPAPSGSFFLLSCHSILQRLSLALSLHSSGIPPLPMSQLPHPLASVTMLLELCLDFLFTPFDLSALGQGLGPLALSSSQKAPVTQLHYTAFSQPCPPPSSITCSLMRHVLLHMFPAGNAISLPPVTASCPDPSLRWFSSGLTLVTVLLKKINK